MVAFTVTEEQIGKEHLYEVDSREPSSQSCLFCQKEVEKILYKNIYGKTIKIYECRDCKNFMPTLNTKV